MAIKYTRNPGITRTREYEMSALDQNKLLENAKDIIFDSKRKITGFTSLDKKNRIKKDGANHMYMLSLARNLDPDEGVEIFERLWSANSTDMGHPYLNDHIKVPLELLTEAQIIALPRGSFSDEEWGSLSDTIRTHIEGSKISEQGLVDDLYISLGEDFEEMMQEQADTDPSEAGEDLYNYLNREYPDSRATNKMLVEVAKGMDQEFLNQLLNTWVDVLDEDDIYQVTADFLRDPDSWTGETVGWDYEENPFVYPIPRRLLISKNYLRDVDDIVASKGAKYASSILDALRKKLNNNFPGDEGTFDEATSGPWLTGLSLNSDHRQNLEPRYAIYFRPNLGIEEPLNDALNERAGDVTTEQFESDGEPLPEEDRILYTFKDGAYAIRLIPEDLEPVGEELSQCIRDPSYGFGTKIKRGTHALYLIRTKAGRPKITIEVKLDRDGNPVEVEQIHGKGNRMPGWRTGFHGEGKVKWMEVQKVGKVLELLGLSPTSEEAGEYLGAAHRAMQELGIEALTQNPCPYCEDL
jgi:hypothetical protein